MTDDAPDAAVLLVVDDAAVRAELRERLDGEDGFVPRVGPAAAPFDADFDVCLLDAAGLRAHADALAAVRATTRAYLPAVLVVPADAGDPEETLAALGEAGEAVDDLLAHPAGGPALERRLRSLARAKRRSAEAAAGRDRLRRLVRYLPDAVFRCREGTVTYANPVAESLLGAEPTGLAGRSFASLVPPVDRDAVTSALACAADTGRGGPVETVLARSVARDADGGVADDRDGADAADAVGTARERPASVPVEVTAIDVGDGEVQVLARDLRERREREDRLALYRRAMDEATVGITIADHTDDDEVLVYANNEFKRLTGLSGDELLGRNPGSSRRTRPTWSRWPASGAPSTPARRRRSCC
ncbi:PAS domain S-box protein [Halobaculum litoreum]|uniref:PAS domain S-box protein n=1 Tax=Halobaculum litoreum TaxID=3031998 RepID=A0ABD5XMP9_9EURY